MGPYHKLSLPGTSVAPEAQVTLEICPKPQGSRSTGRVSKAPQTQMVTSLITDCRYQLFLSGKPTFAQASRRPRPISSKAQVAPRWGIQKQLKPPGCCAYWNLSVANLKFWFFKKVAITDTNFVGQAVLREPAVRPASLLPF